MEFLKWICFLLVCGDTLGYILQKANKLNEWETVIGLCIGTAMRCFVLYGTLTCWLLT